jgi:AraC family transcriptional regulator of adaptative response/methylated-DNA-[protein]-cysteine methyltransferase
MLSTMKPNDAPSQRLHHALRAAADADFAGGVARMAELAGYSPGHFQRAFRRHFGISPGRFLRHERIDRFAALLRQGLPVTDAAIEAGFGSSSRAFEAARDGLGMAPSRLARGGDGETIHYGTAACRLGRVLVASTPRGICAILLGDLDATLRADLEKRFPRASLEKGGESFQSTLDRVIGLIDHSDDPREPLPLDLRGTVFQRKVWDALQDIPPGRTTTYGELARRVGLPGGARAVAQACGANPAAVIVPCHRVVAANGGLGGYRWGVERKQMLLEGERDGA